MKLSIIIPAYNTEKFIGQAVESILAQECRSCEILIVDDGSTDGTGNIIDSYADKYEQVKAYHKANGGQGSARNTGLRYARGEWVYFADADDFLLPSSLERLLQLLKQSKNADMLLVDTYSYFESAQKYELFSGGYPKGFLEGEENGRQKFIRMIKRSYSYGYCACFYLVKRELLLEHGICFPEAGTSNDIEFSCKVWCYAGNPQYMPVPLYAYRREQEGSITHNPNYKWCSCILVRISNCLDFLEEQNAEEELLDFFRISFQHLVTVIFSSFTCLTPEEKSRLCKEIKRLKCIYRLKDKRNMAYTDLRLRLVRSSILLFGPAATAYLYQAYKKVSARR